MDAHAVGWSGSPRRRGAAAPVRRATPQAAVEHGASLAGHRPRAVVHAGGLTGAPLVYRDALDRWLNPTLLTRRAQGPALPIAEVVERATLSLGLGRLRKRRGERIARERQAARQQASRG